LRMMSGNVGREWCASNAPRRPRGFRSGESKG
jgi:hypothetical protein